MNGYLSLSLLIGLIAQPQYDGVWQPIGLYQSYPATQHIVVGSDIGIMWGFVCDPDWQNQVPLYWELEGNTWLPNDSFAGVHVDPQGIEWQLTEIVTVDALTGNVTTNAISVEYQKWIKQYATDPNAEYSGPGPLTTFIFPMPEFAKRKADVNRDGKVTTQDITDFLKIWNLAKKQ